MSRTRVSTTVDGDLLTAVRERRPGVSDSSVLEEALQSLLADLRREEIDRAYREAYGRVPVDTPDAWGSPASFAAAAGAS